MNRTAEQMFRLSSQDRLPLVLHCRQASFNPHLPENVRAMYRMAARYLAANMDTPAYDLLARLQILESAAKVVAPKPMTAGPWSKNPRQGLASARDYYQGTDIDPEWLSAGNTGFIGIIQAMVRKDMREYTHGRESFVSPEDHIQNGLMGLTKSGTELLSTGPLLIHFGYTYPSLFKILTSGRLSPRDLAGVAAKNFVKKVRDHFQKGDLSRAPTETKGDSGTFEHQKNRQDGTSIFDMQQSPQSNLDFTEFLQELLSSNNPLGKDLERRMRALAGKNAVANEIINRLVSGSPIGTVSAIHKALGGSGSGQAVVWTKEFFYPAVAEMVQEDPNLQMAYMRLTGRTASKRSR